MLARPPCSRSTRQKTPATFMPASRVVSMAVMVLPPVVQTSSTMTTEAPGFKKAFDAAAGTVSLFGLTDEEAVDERGAVVVARVPGAGAGDVGDERVCAHGEASDGFGLREVAADKVVEDDAGETAALGVQRGDAAVDVVVAAGSAGEGEVAELEGEGGDEVEQGRVVVDHGSIVGLNGG